MTTAEQVDRAFGTHRIDNASLDAEVGACGYRDALIELVEIAIHVAKLPSRCSGLRGCPVCLVKAFLAKLEATDTTRADGGAGSGDEDD